MSYFYPNFPHPEAVPRPPATFPPNLASYPAQPPQNVGFPQQGPRFGLMHPVAPPLMPTGQIRWQQPIAAPPLPLAAVRAPPKPKKETARGSKRRSGGSEGGGLSENDRRLFSTMSRSLVQILGELQAQRRAMEQLVTLSNAQKIEAQIARNRRAQKPGPKGNAKPKAKSGAKIGAPGLILEPTLADKPENIEAANQSMALNGIGPAEEGSSSQA